MTKLVTPKSCPFCIGETYAYKTRDGLLRHVMSTHMCDSRHRIIYAAATKSSYVRIDTETGPIYERVTGWSEVEDFLLDYLADYNNPSKRSSRFWRYVR